MGERAGYGRVIPALARKEEVGRLSLKKGIHFCVGSGACPQTHLGGVRGYTTAPA